MSAITINTGPMVDDLGLLVNNQSNKPPFQAPHGLLAKTYVVGTDFTSGDSLIFQVKASPGKRFAAFTAADGSAITFTEAAVASVSGFKLTLAGTHTGNVSALIYFDI